MGMVAFVQKSAFLTAVMFGILMIGAVSVQAHCDSEVGPVANDARKALEEENPDAVVIWVGEKQEPELRETYQKSLEVYEEGGKARNLAERYFVETAVRLHRQAEGKPYTGLKPEGPLPPDVEAAENALETGRADHLIELLTDEMESNVRHWFERAREARQHRDEGVEVGRAYVDVYVKYIVYIHGLYGAITAGPEHGVRE